MARSPAPPGHPSGSRGAGPRRGRTALRLVAVLIILLYPLAAGSILLTTDGWAINRLNVRIWITVTKPLGLTGVITPEMFADAMNVLLFIPFFAALSVLVPTWWWILLGAAMSSAVETYQAAIGTRDATVVDVLTNTLGAALGVTFGISQGWVAIFRRPHASSEASAR